MKIPEDVKTYQLIVLVWSLRDEVCVHDLFLFPIFFWGYPWNSSNTLPLHSFKTLTSGFWMIYADDCISFFFIRSKNFVTRSFDEALYWLRSKLTTYLPFAMSNTILTLTQPLSFMIFSNSLRAQHSEPCPPSAFHMPHQGIPASGQKVQAEY